MAMSQNRRPKFSRREAEQSDSDSDYDLGQVMQKQKQKARKNREDEEDDEISTVSFGVLNKAQQTINSKSKGRDGDYDGSDSEDSDDSEGGTFFEEEDQERRRDNDGRRNKPSKKSSTDKKKKSNHAPSEQSAKKPVRKIREIPGLRSAKDTTLHTDIRFDTAYGKADLDKTRKNYAFLDEYRKKEVQDMQDLLRANEKKRFLESHEVEDLQYQIQSLKSRMDTLKNRDLEKKVIKDFKEKQGANGTFFLKNSDRRKLVQKAKFDNMKSRQRDKVMERKRKKRLGKEYKQMEFL